MDYNIKNYDLIIFDCDGTLVNTEIPSQEVNSKLITDLGIEGYTPQRCDEDFTGVSWSGIRRILMERHNIEISENYIDNYVVEMLKRADEGFEPIPNGLEFFKQLSDLVKTSIASSGAKPNVLKSLEVMGYIDFISNDRILTVEDVANPKPAPDIYLLAAQKMGVEPSRCLVIEDSPTGATAGVAAGMDVFGFTGTAHDENAQKEKLLDVGAKAVFNDFIHMAQALGY